MRFRLSDECSGVGLAHDCIDTLEWMKELDPDEATMVAVVIPATNGKTFSRSYDFASWFPATSKGLFRTSNRKTMTGATLPDGILVGRYQIHTILGAGGMGEVYLARDTELDRLVAIKILPSTLTCDPHRVERFIIEAKAASALNHPSIVTIYEMGEASVTGSSDEAVLIHYIAMEYIDGVTLDVWFREEPPVSSVLSVLGRVAEGLGKAHARGIVHRDLKPDNIMITAEGHAKVLDFGVAKLIGVETRDEVRSPSGRRTLTEPTTLLGTVGYMSPEQIEGYALDHRTDIFSLGCILYESIAGKSPFAGATNAETMHRIVHRDPLPLKVPDARLGAALQRILDRCLAKDREQRYDSARDLGLDLLEAAAIVAPPRRKRRFDRLRHSGRFRAAAATLAILLAVMVLRVPAGAVLTTVAAAVGPSRHPEVQRLERTLAEERAQYVTVSRALTEREGEISRRGLEIDRLRSERDDGERIRGDLENSYRKLLTDVNIHLKGSTSESTRLRERVATAESELQKAREESKTRSTQQERLASIQRSLAAVVEARFETRGLVVTIPGLFYRSGHDRIRGESTGVLNRIAEQLVANPDVKVTIEGHTDSSGGEDDNLSLSQRRADGLQDILAAAGVDPSRITSVGRGEMVPISDNSSSEGLARNRRIELILGH